jgi:putative ABC transport system permease protein
LPLAAGWIADITIPISWISIVLAFLLSFTVGITSGLIPANRAAKLDPTEALRYE